MTNTRENPLIVTQPDHLTAHWAQRVVNQQAIPEQKKTKIQHFEVISVDVGTTTRVRLKVEHDGPTTLPKRWFVKLPSLSWRAKAITALPRLLPTEVKFYKELAPVIPINKPQMLAAHSRFGKGSTLVINDVTEANALPGRAGDALTFNQARAVVEHLARCHAHFIHKVKRDPGFQWLAGPVRRLEDGLGTALAVPLMKRGLQLAGDIIPHSLHKSAMEYARNRKLIMQFLSAKTPTLVHHDCHPGNLFWHNDEPGFLDWQMVRLGEAISDISYFLATALLPEVRRQHETALLSHYHELLSVHGAAEIEFNELYQRFKAHLCYPFEAMVVTLAVGGMMQLDSNLEMIRRAALAAQDHDTFACLPNKS
ncbi:MAG: DUF1679 domain-containing protein [Gammaproteobacteria bacterium]|nr:DUF1679 domain-containing protein [Gammaproteobacteria bacterium]